MATKKTIKSKKPTKAKVVKAAPKKKINPKKKVAVPKTANEFKGAAKIYQTKNTVCKVDIKKEGNKTITTSTYYKKTPLTIKKAEAINKGPVRYKNQ